MTKVYNFSPGPAALPEVVLERAREDLQAIDRLEKITAHATGSGRRIASSLAESAVDSLVARRMVKKQQMQWTLKGAHRMLQVRAAVLNGDLRERLAWQPPKPTHRYR